MGLSDGERSAPASIVFGVFKGMGDVLSAAPVIREELRRGVVVHLLLFPNPMLHEFCGLLDFSPHQGNLRLHSMPTGGFASWWRFFAAMRRISPEMVWVSPHAPAPDSSWKIPLVLWVARSLFWGGAEMVGAGTESLSRLFDRRLPVDRSLPLRQREWSAYRLLRGPLLPEDAPQSRFLPEIMARREAAPVYDLVIHPGAIAANRRWSFGKYAPLVAVLPREWRIALLGLPDDIAALKPTMPADRGLEYVTGTIRKSIETLASARILLLMDSGNMHFAQVLGVPSVALFGYHDPATVIDLTGCVEAIYKPRFPCQPCDKGVCSQPEIYCMNSLEPEAVAERLKALSEKAKWRQSPMGQRLLRIAEAT